LFGRVKDVNNAIIGRYVYVLTDAVGNVVSRRDFMPFGEEIYADGQTRLDANKYSLTGQDAVRQRFTGYQKDSETQLDFAENRMYQNMHGRFTAVDPLLASGKSANPQTFNRYVYVLNNPLMLTDPDGLQVGVHTGKVYQRGNSFAIFRGRPYAGYKPVTQTINTQTTIRGIQHHLTVTPRGWTVGDRVDALKFAGAPTSPPAVRASENGAIRALATGVTNGIRDAETGIPKVIGNSPAVALNGLTSCFFNCGVQGLYFRGSNPFAVPLPFSYNNAREASYGSAGTTASLLAPAVVAPVVAGSSALPSVVPPAEVPVSFFDGASYTSKVAGEMANEKDIRHAFPKPSGISNLTGRLQHSLVVMEKLIKCWESLAGMVMRMGHLNS
jgi:RHS repeat-associated protein